MSKNIVILGGGTAGLLTAIYARKVLPQYNIKLVRSQEIGIVGVGESTTPQFVTMLQGLEIDIFECMRKSKASIKNGIKFSNWNGDGKSYFHSFNEWVTDWKVPDIFGSECRDFYIMNLINQDLPFDQYIYAEFLSLKNHIDLDNTAWSLHFDAGLMASYLEEVALKRNIEILDEIYEDLETDNNGYIKKIKFQTKTTLDCVFVFDCTGFHRSLIGKYFKQKWISYEKYLPMNKAIPFWLENEKDIEPFTTSTALKNGWMWKIPLVHRIGCGYIFDNNYISVDDAKKEVEDYLGREIEIRKIIDFRPGRFENVWIKNCMAIGLSSHFLEPIESTSLWITVTQLNLFAHFLDDIETPSLDSQKSFNKMVNEGIDGCMYFVYLHYFTKRHDSKFWQEFKDKHPIPDELNIRLKLLIENKLKYCDIGKNISIAWFPLSSYLQVGKGLDLIKSNKLSYYNVQPTPAEYHDLILNKFAHNSYSNKQFLDDINSEFPSL